MLLSKLQRTALMACVFLTTFPVLPASASHLRRGPTSSKSNQKLRKGAVSIKSRSTVSSRPRAIDDARATEIQGALVKAGYLQSASGHWDDASADAMRKLQADNGWQTKLIPDSRALIKLGLGANTGDSGDNAINLITPAE